MRISEWSSDVCSSDLLFAGVEGRAVLRNIFLDGNTFADSHSVDEALRRRPAGRDRHNLEVGAPCLQPCVPHPRIQRPAGTRPDRKSVGEGKSWSVRVELGGRRIINKKKQTKTL